MPSPMRHPAISFSLAVLDKLVFLENASSRLDIGDCLFQACHVGFTVKRIGNDFERDSLVLGDFHGKHRKRGRHREPHFLSGLFHIAFQGRVHSEIYHSLCHIHRLLLVYSIMDVMQNQSFAFNMLHSLENK